MSLSTKKRGGNFTYCKVMNGKIVVTCKEGDEGAVPRTISKGDRKGEVVYEQHYTGISGDLRNVSVVEGKFGKELHIHIVSEEGEYVIQMGLSDTYATAFICRLPNLDFNKPVEICPYMFKGTEGKQKPWLTIYQDEEQVPTKWDSKSEELPKLKEIEVSGKKQLDATDRMNFFEKFIDDQVNPILIERWKAENAAEEAEGEAEFETETEAETQGEAKSEPTDEELAAQGAPKASGKGATKKTTK